MGGIEFRDEALVVDRSPNQLDELALAFSKILGRFDIDHVFVAGYVAILAGRARSTEDIDVIIEVTNETRIGALTDALLASDYWGPAMPLEDMFQMLDRGDHIWVAPEDQITPHLEVSFPTDEFDHASLENSITAQIGDETVPIGPLELQIAYKLYLGTRTDFEDAIHLYSLFEETLSKSDLERWVTRLEVEEEYERLE